MPRDSLDGHCPKCLGRIIFINPSADAKVEAGQTIAEEQRGAEILASQGRELESVGLNAGWSAIAKLSRPAEFVGQRIGRYRMLEKIGEGGFGIVYMAEQLEPVSRKVAFKIIKAGMDSHQIIARFEAERQALALMDHPNIARVLDAGTTDTGRPYFVMELVRGIPITGYCDKNNLSTQQRLELFIKACRAIQHAHQKGIIHRDIKPSNILVTLHDGVPVPKVIDFGIAKATSGQRLTDKTLFTAFEQFIGTPAYMSPEQAEMSGLDIDTRSDIYSLGVLLYELLTGNTPFGQKELMAAGIDEMRRVIREKEPLTPSTRLFQDLVAATRESAANSGPDRNRAAGFGSKDSGAGASRRCIGLKERIALVRGDLDWIVMKALEKDRTRRYETANGLALDVERHLRNEPVTAAAPSVAYRAKKFVRRHKTGLITASALLVLLITGLLASALEAIRANYAEKRATIEGSKSRQVATFLQKMLDGVGPSYALGRDTQMLREILDSTAKSLGEDLKGQPEVEAEIRGTIGRVYCSLDELPKAEEMQRRALKLWENAAGKTSLQTAGALNDLTEVLMPAGKLAEAEETARQALAVRQKLLPANHQDVATSLNNLGVVLRERYKYDEAEILLRKALDIQRKLFPGDSDRVAETITSLSSLLWSKGDFVPAEALNREALAIYRRLRPKDDPEISNSLNNLGTVLRSEGKLPEAKEALSEALMSCRRVFPPGHLTLARTIQNLAGVYYDGQEWTQAEALYREVLPVRIERYGSNSAEAAEVLNNLGTVFKGRGDFPESVAVLGQVVAINHSIFTNDHKNLAVSIYNLAGAKWELADFYGAESLYREAVAMLTRLYSQRSREVGLALNNLGTALREQGKLAEAEKIHREALAIQRELKLDDDVVGSLNNLGTVLERQHRLDEAEPITQEAVDTIRRRAGTNSLVLFFPLGNLASIQLERKKLPEAEVNAGDLMRICKSQLANDWRVYDSESLLGSVLTANGNYSEAGPLLLSGYQGMQQSLGKLPPRLRPRIQRAGERVVQFYDASGDSEKAADWKKRLSDARPEPQGTTPAKL
jgi:serine/threonine protein kinase/Tfp pilus assembly protein PilF